MGLIPLGILSSAGGGFGTYELIQTQILGSTTASITFSGLATYASTYEHLQIRYTARQTNTGSVGMSMRLNGDTASNYSYHYLGGTGSSVLAAAGVTQTSMIVGSAFGTSAAANAFGAGVIDLTDAFSTSKNKTTRTLEGRSSEWIALISGNWRNTASITSIQLFPDVYSFVTGSRFSLYGIR
jgi:hypothetical protein